jgi:cytochrome c553
MANMKTIASFRSQLRLIVCAIHDKAAAARRSFGAQRSGDRRAGGLIAALSGTLAIVGVNTLFPPTVNLHAQARPRIDPVQLQTDVNRLKQLVPSQSHTMADVGYQWTNLWFAAEKKNWPLAQFYFDEARSHILWTIRIRPVRRNPDGSPVDIKAIYDRIDSSSMNAVNQAIAQKDSAQFVTTYKAMLDACYACHKASAKPYLRPMIPKVPASTIINFDPDAKWPQ